MTDGRWCCRHEKVHAPDEFGALCAAWDDVEQPRIPLWRWRRWFPARKRKGDS